MAYPAVTAFLKCGDISDERSPEARATAVIYQAEQAGVDLRELLRNVLIVAFRAEDEINK